MVSTRSHQESEFSPELPSPITKKQKKSKEVEVVLISDTDDIVETEAPLMPIASRRTTRASAKRKDTRDPAIVLFYYPFEAKQRVPITVGDKRRTEQGMFLNDSLIDWYLLFLSASKWLPAIAEKVHIFSSFFYRRLTHREDAKAHAAEHDRVKRWTAKVDIFSKDYLVVPINESVHWYLAIICFSNRCQVQPKPSSSSASVSVEDTSFDINTGDNAHSHCVILILDSLGKKHPWVFKNLKKYILAESHARHPTKPTDETLVEKVYCKVPIQPNSFDCGVFLLHNVERFFHDPQINFMNLTSGDSFETLKWFPFDEITKKRTEMDKLIEDLQVAYVEMNSKKKSSAAVVTEVADDDSNAMVITGSKESNFVQDAIEASTEIKPTDTSDERKRQTSPDMANGVEDDDDDDAEIQNEYHRGPVEQCENDSMWHDFGGRSSLTAVHASANSPQPEELDNMSIKSGENSPGQVYAMNEENISQDQVMKDELFNASPQVKRRNSIRRTSRSSDDDDEVQEDDQIEEDQVVEVMIDRKGKGRAVAESIDSMEL